MEYSLKKKQFGMMKLIVIALFFICSVFPIIIIEGFKILPIILVGVIALSLGNRFHSYIINKEKHKKYPFLLSNLVILIYVLFYIFLTVIIDFSLFKTGFTLIYTKMILGFYILFLGLEGIRTKKMHYGMGLMTKKQSVIFGVIDIIISLVILFAGPLIKLVRLIA